MKTSYINPKTPPPSLYFGIGGVAKISSEILDYVTTSILDYTETEEHDGIRDFEEREGDFVLELCYPDVTVVVTGKLSETWRYWKSYDYDQPSEWEMLTQYIEIDDLDCTDENGDFVPTDFDKRAYNEAQYNNRKAA